MVVVIEVNVVELGRHWVVVNVVDQLHPVVVTDPEGEALPSAVLLVNLTLQLELRQEVAVVLVPAPILPKSAG